MLKELRSHVPSDRQVYMVEEDLLMILERSPMWSGVCSNTTIIPGVLVVASHLLDEVVYLDNVGVLWNEWDE